DMLKNEDLDYVINLTPHNLHYEVIATAAKYNVNVLTEKPLGRSLIEAVKIYKSLKRSKINVMVALQRKFSKSANEFQNFITKLKNIYFIEGKYTINIERPDEGWRGKRLEAGGGCIVDMGYHIIDLLIWYFGLPDSVYVEYGTKAVSNKNYDAEDTAAILFSYSNKMFGTLIFSRSYYPETEYFKVVASNGIAELNRDGAYLLNKNGKIIKAINEKYDKVNLIMKEIDYFTKLVNGDIKENVSDVKYNIQHLGFVEACYDAYKKKFPVNPKILLKTFQRD
ncbi:MAG: Gfo/Idh/MocA family protein, partial [Hydrogenobaculum sp.]